MSVLGLKEKLQHKSKYYLQHCKNAKLHISLLLEFEKKTLSLKNEYLIAKPTFGMQLFRASQRMRRQLPHRGSV